jgi:transposase
MRIIGLDLGISGDHKGVVMKETGQFAGPVFKLRTWPSELSRLLERGRQEVEGTHPVSVVMEPTGYAWLPVASYLCRQEGVTVYLVNAQQVADLRSYYKKHAKSDRIDSRVLSKIWLISPEKLHPLHLPSGEILALRQGCKQLDQVTERTTALQNQLIALDRTIWLGGFSELVFKEPFQPAPRWVRRHYYDPTVVLERGAEVLRQHWQAEGLDDSDPGAWTVALAELAQKVVTIYGHPSPYVDFAAFQAEAVLKEQSLAHFEAQRDHLRFEVVRPLYRQLHPSRHLESLKGVGQESAAVFLSFVGQPERFAHSRAFRGWSGLVPRSAQSADRESKGLHISQAGPKLVKKYAFLDANVARLWDPQLAKIYYDQMVHKGQHHTQAVCAVATHLLDRILVILKQDRPYQLRDVDGSSVTPQQARKIARERYTVPEEVRKRNNRRPRKKRTDRRAERTFARQQRQKGQAHLAG